MTTLTIKTTDIVGRKIRAFGTVLIYTDSSKEQLQVHGEPYLYFESSVDCKKMSAFYISGYTDIAMLKAFCEQVLKSADRENK